MIYINYKMQILRIVAVSAVVLIAIAAAFAGQSEERSGGDLLEQEIQSYSNYLVELRSLDKSMDYQDGQEWIDRLIAVYGQSDHHSFRQTALVAVMSIHNSFAEWPQAEEACLLAIDIAYSDAVRLERYADLFAIHSAMANENGRAVEQRWDTFEKLNALYQKFTSGQGLGRLNRETLSLYRWALEERVKRSAELEDTEATTGWALSFVEFASHTMDAGALRIPEHAVNHYRALAARKSLSAGDHANAVAAVEGTAQYPMAIEPIEMAIERQETEHIARFVSDVELDRFAPSERLLVAYHFAECAFRALAAKNDDVLMEGTTTIDDPDILFAFMYLEGVVSDLLPKQPSVHHPVRVSSDRLSTEQLQLLRRSSELLVDFLILDGQREAAERYTQLAHEKYSVFKH